MIACGFGYVDTINYLLENPIISFKDMIHEYDKVIITIFE